MAASRSQVSKCSSLSVAPAGLGYIATTQSVTLECMKKARPIGIRNCAHSSSGSSKPSSQSVRVPTVPAGREHVYHQYTVRVREGVDRDAVMKRLNERGVGARVYYPLPIHRQPVFARRAEYQNLSLPETELATREVISLPVHPLLTEEERAFVAAEVNAAC